MQPVRASGQRTIQYALNWIPGGWLFLGSPPVACYPWVDRRHNTVTFLSSAVIDNDVVLLASARPGGGGLMAMFYFRFC